MSNPTHAISQYLDSLTENARALIAATSDVAETRVCEARKKLSSALDSSRDIYGRVRKSAVHSAKVADRSVRDNPYAPIGVALILGALLALLLCRSRD